MYERKTAIPMFLGDGDPQMNRNEESQFDDLRRQYSICDIIKQIGGRGQAMEVVEHILHHITMVGLHFTFNDEWGVSRNSDQYS